MTEFEKKLDSVVKRIGRDAEISHIKSEIDLLSAPYDKVYVSKELILKMIGCGEPRRSEILDFLGGVIDNAIKDSKELAIRDGLTGLLNKTQLDFELKRELAFAFRNPSHSLTLMMFDIDDFKAVNDEYGHGVGDFVLKKLGEVLLDNLRASDLAFRVGGEEFIVLLPNTSEKDAIKVMRKLRFKIKRCLEMIGDKEGGGFHRPITLSGGVLEIKKNSPVWLLYGERGRKLIMDFLEERPGRERELTIYLKNSPRIVKKEELEKGIREMVDFVRACASERKVNVSEIVSPEFFWICAQRFLLDRVDKLVYYVKNNGKDNVGYVSKGSIKMVEDGESS